MKGWILMLAFTLVIVTLLSIGAYVSVTQCFKFPTIAYRSKHTSVFFGGTDTETRQETYKLNSHGTISVKTENGAIAITSHEKPEVLVKITKEGDKRDFSCVITKIDSELNTLSLETVYKKDSCNASISYELIVPKDAAVTTKTTNGTTTITNVGGKVKAKSCNGSLILEQTPHLVKAVTINGKVKVTTDTIVPASEPIVLETTNGSISFAVKRLEKNNFSIKTTNGSITIDLPENPINYRCDKNSASFSIAGFAIGSEEANFESGKAFFEVAVTNGTISINHHAH